MLAFANRRTQIDDLQRELYAVVHSVFNFAPFILIQFDFTNAHVDNYNAIAAISRSEKRAFSIYLCIVFRACYEKPTHHDKLITGEWFFIQAECNHFAFKHEQFQFSISFRNSFWKNDVFFVLHLEMRVMKTFGRLALKWSSKTVLCFVRYRNTHAWIHRNKSLDRNLFPF